RGQCGQVVEPALLALQRLQVRLPPGQLALHAGHLADRLRLGQQRPYPVDAGLLRLDPGGEVHHIAGHVLGGHLARLLGTDVADVLQRLAEPVRRDPQGDGRGGLVGVDGALVAADEATGTRGETDEPVRGRVHVVHPYRDAAVVDDAALDGRQLWGYLRGAAGPGDLGRRGDRVGRARRRRGLVLVLRLQRLLRLLRRHRGPAAARRRASRGAAAAGEHQAGADK